MKKIIHYCWFGPKPLPKLAKKCIASWEKFLPDYEIKLWSENNVDLNECDFIKEAYEQKKWAFVADYVRTKALYEYGGIYMDTDMEITKPVDDLLTEDFVIGVEDSGYIARVAFVMDKLLRKLGLSGRSIVPLLIGFGCTVPAVMATRTLPSERDRKMTILLTPFMSCTAKLPIYAFFVNAFFPNQGGIIMVGLYLLGIIVGILIALLFKKTLFKGEAVPFVMELPNYRMPTFKNTSLLLWDKAKDFLQRAFTIIFLATLIIWFLQSFDIHFTLVEDSKDSILAMISSLLVPIFKPIGLGDWRICTSLITGFIAKESVVSTMEVLFAGQGITQVLSTLSAASLLIFSLLYSPCAAAISSIKNELGGKWALGVVLWQCGIAWLASFAVYLIGGLMI